MEIRRGIIVSRIDIDCCDVVTLIVEAIDFTNRAVFSLLFGYFVFVRGSG
jgi:hypothetical protein